MRWVEFATLNYRMGRLQARRDDAIVRYARSGRSTPCAGQYGPLGNVAQPVLPMLPSETILDGSPDREQLLREPAKNGVVGRNMAVSYLNVLPGAASRVMVAPVVTRCECRACSYLIASAGILGAFHRSRPWNRFAGLVCLRHLWLNLRTTRPTRN